MSYPEYLKKEWDLFHADPNRERASLEAAGGVAAHRVLDVGCGAGQELLPFVKRGAIGVGIDIAHDSGMVARKLFREIPEVQARFVQGRGEALPFASDTFDLVMCRVALPYMRNPAALPEMSRVLRPGGRLIVKIHHPKYYRQELAASVRRRNWRGCVHALRVLTTGVVYAATGRQFAFKPLLPETFQTRRMLARELRDCQWERNMGDSAATPSLIFSKR